MKKSIKEIAQTISKIRNKELRSKLAYACQDILCQSDPNFNLTEWQRASKMEVFDTTFDGWIN